MIIASYRVECDSPGCTNRSTNTYARAENSAPWEPKPIRAAAQVHDGFERRGRLDLCPACAAPPTEPPPTLFAEGARPA